MRLSEQDVSLRRQRLAVATTQARALAREVNRLRAEILSGESQDDSPDPRQLELPEVSPTPTPALAQAEPARLPTLLERLTLAEPVRCLLTPVERALSPGALALYRELRKNEGPGPSAKLTQVDGLDLELVYELCAFHLVVVHHDGFSTSSRPTTCCLAYDPDSVRTRAAAVVEPLDGEVLEEIARYLGEAGSVTALRDKAETPSVVVRAALRQFEAWRVVDLQGDDYVRCVRVPLVEAAILEALRLSPGLSRSGLARSISCPESLVEWSLATLHEAGVVVEQDHYVVLNPSTYTPLTEQQVDELVEPIVLAREGGGYPAPVIARRAMLPIDTTRQSLRRLVEAGRVRESGSADSPRYAQIAREKPMPTKAKGKPAKAKGRAKANAEGEP